MEQNFTVPNKNYSHNLNKFIQTGMLLARKRTETKCKCSLKRNWMNQQHSPLKSLRRLAEETRV
jgi:hypothetical protein